MKEHIEREALLNSFEELINIACEQGSPRIGKAMRTGTCAGIAFCRNEVRHAPAADVEGVRHGRWVWNENAMDWGIGGWVCSECRAKNDNIPAKPDIHPSAWVGSQYCPHCGCKMDKEE